MTGYSETHRQDGVNFQNKLNYFMLMIVPMIIYMVFIAAVNPIRLVRLAGRIGKCRDILTRIITEP